MMNDNIPNTSSQLIQQDPVLRFIYIKRNWTDIRTILYVVGLSGFLFLVLGSIASWTYSGTGNGILHIGNLGFIIAWLLFTAPLYWKMYLWQAQSFPSLITYLSNDGIFGHPNSKDRKAVEKQNIKILFSLNRPWIFIVIILFIILFWLNGFLLEWPKQFLLREEYWFEVKWYLPFHIIAWSLSLFPLFIFILRQVIFVLGINRIFRKAEVKIKPLHPDAVGGFRPLGEFVKTSMFFAFGIGINASLYALLVYSVKGNILRIDVLAFFTSYIFLVPICLLIPVFSARTAMLRARERFLEPVSNEFQNSLKNAQSKISLATPIELKELNENIDELKKHHDMIVRIYPTMPLSIRAFRNFSITALIPLITAVASIIIELFFQ